MFTFFALGTFAFWILFSIFIVAETVCVETESLGWGVTFLVLFVLALTLGGSVPIFKWIAANPALATLYAGLYFVAGTIWAVAKWTLLCLDVANRLKDLREKFLIETKKSFNLDEFTRWLGYNSRRYRRIDLADVPLRVSESKERITGWMVWWPVSVSWTILDDFVKRIFEHIYNAIRGTLQAISDRTFKGVLS